MPDFTLRPKARQDLADIWHYTLDTWGEQQAENYIRDLNDGFYQLVNAPNTGRDCGHIREGYRKYPVGRHVIFYRLVSESDIEIVRILHERMDPEQHLPE